MQKVSFRKLSLLGLVLMGASAVTAAILPKSDTKRTFNGNKVASTGGAGNQISCVAGINNFSCTVTANSATTTNPNIAGHQPNGTSAGNNGSSVTDEFGNHINSSQSPS